MGRSIPSIDFRLATSANQADRDRFVSEVGDALKDIGFFALTHHGIARELIDATYEQCDAFFDMDEQTKRTYLQPEIGHQRGYTAFGVEHAKHLAHRPRRRVPVRHRTSVRGHGGAGDAPALGLFNLPR